MPSQHQAASQKDSDSEPLSILDIDDMYFFIDHALLTTHGSRGTGFISGYRKALRDSSVPRACSFREIFREDDDTETITIPMFIESCATYEYLGLSAEAATCCWGRWVTDLDRLDHPEGRGKTFIANAKQLLSTRRALIEPSAMEDRYWVMREIGCSEELIEAIMTSDPESEVIRECESALFWVLDTLDLRWKALLSLPTKSSLRARQLQNGGNLEAHGDRIPSKFGATPASIVPRRLYDHVQLWKGVDEDTVEGLLSDDGTLVSMSKLKTCAGYSFTTDRSVAVAYANWIQQRSAASSGVVISFQVPEGLINGLEKVELGYSEEDDTWAKFVWCSRNGCNRFEALPRMDELEKKQLIVRHMSRCNPRQLYEMESYREITKEHLFCLPNSGMVGMEYFFRLDVEQAFLRMCSDKLIICEKTAQKPNGLIVD